MQPFTRSDTGPRAATAAEYSQCAHPRGIVMILLMHPDHDTWTIMRDALARACDDFKRAAEQAVRLRHALEHQPPEDAARAAAARDGGESYLQVLQRACTALDEMRAAYHDVGQTIIDRAATAAAQAKSRPPAAN